MILLPVVMQMFQIIPSGANFKRLLLQPSSSLHSPHQQSPIPSSTEKGRTPFIHLPKWRDNGNGVGRSRTGFVRNKYQLKLPPPPSAPWKRKTAVALRRHLRRLLFRF